MTLLKLLTLVSFLQLMVSCAPSNNNETTPEIAKYSVITLTDAYQADTLKLYNPSDTSLWHQFSFVYDDSDGQYDFEHPGFRPFNFHPDYYQLGLFSEHESSAFYVVQVDDLGTEKLLRKSRGLKRVSLAAYLADFESLGTHKPLLAQLPDGLPHLLNPGAYALEGVSDGRAIMRVHDGAGQDTIVSLPVVQDGEIVVFPLLD